MAKVLLIAYDNGSHIPFFPQHLFYLAGSLKKAGHDVGFWLQDIHHGREEALTDIIDSNPFDVVGLGFVAGYWQYAKAKKISAAVNASKRRKEVNYVLGGHGPAAEPEFFLEKMGADTVVIGDGEKAIRAAAHGKRGIIHGEPCTADEAPLEMYRAFPLDIYRLIRWPTSTNMDLCMPILSSRGCKWSCSFCYRMRAGFHERAVEAIMEEIKYLHACGINHFQFSDELLMSSEARAEEICMAISRLPFRIKWDCNGRLNFATSILLKTMRESGCEYINYGIESLNQTLLNQMGKGLSVETILRGVENTLEAKIFPGLNLLWGFPGDTENNLDLAVESLLKYDPCHELRTIRPVTPYPGTPLYRKAITDGLLSGPEEFYEARHVNSDLIAVNFMEMPTEEAHRALWRANSRLVRNFMEKRTNQSLQNARMMYLEGDTSFRGFRPI